MSITFDNIPTTLRVPFVFSEFSSTRAQQGPSILAYKGLIIGQKRSTGTGTADTVVRCTTVDQAIALGGRGSMLHRQALAWFAANRSTELWLGILDDNGAGVAATGTIVFTAAATAAGTIAFYLGGERIPVAVASGAATTTMATDTAAAINAALDLPVTAGVSSSTVTLTFRHKGLAGNTYDVRHSFRDTEVLPAGVAMTITAMGAVVAGTTNPTLTNLIAFMTDMWFNVWTHPYTDATSLTALETELTSRFGPTRSIDGIAISSASGSHGTLTTLGTGRNSPHSLIFAQPGASPLTPPMEFAAEVAAIMALNGAADPARPFQTLAMTRAMPVAQTDQWSNDERNLFLFAGIATTKLNSAATGTQLERAITTYRTSPSGATDTAYLDAMTLLTLMYLRYDWRTRVVNKWPRHKLANDGTQFGAGQPVVTPQDGRGEALAWFHDMERLGLVEGFEQFERDLVCERDAVDPNRLNFLMPPDLVNAVIGVASSIQFRL